MELTFWLGTRCNCSLHLLLDANGYLRLDKFKIILDSPSPSFLPQSFPSQEVALPFILLFRQKALELSLISLIPSTTHPIYSSSRPIDSIIQMCSKSDCLPTTLVQAKASFHYGLPKNNCSFLCDESPLQEMRKRGSNVRE